MKDATGILKRHPDNPLIPPKDIPGAMAVSNPSPVDYDGKTILLLSVGLFKRDRGGETYVAESDDGVHFSIADKPFINLRGKPFPFDTVGYHIIDNRVTKIGDTYYIVTPMCSLEYDYPCGVLGKTKDFKTYEVMEIIALPRNRGTSLFPEKIDGMYYRLDRPGAGTGSRGEIWLASSPDLIHWGRYRPVLASGYASWNGSKIGPTPPIKTKEGFLTIVHGVSTPCDGPHYYIGAILLDLEDPGKIIGKTMSYLLAPEEDYETKGRTDNVVFPCGAIADEEKDELRLYYGGADTCVCLATGSVSAVIDACKKEL